MYNEVTFDSHYHAYLVEESIEEDKSIYLKNLPEFLPL